VSEHVEEPETAEAATSECVYCGTTFVGTGDDCGACRLKDDDVGVYLRAHLPSVTVHVPLVEDGFGAGMHRGACACGWKSDAQRAEEGAALGDAIWHVGVSQQLFTSKPGDVETIGFDEIARGDVVDGYDAIATAAGFTVEHVDLVARAKAIVAGGEERDRVLVLRVEARACSYRGTCGVPGSRVHFTPTGARVTCPRHAAGRATIALPRFVRS
jgi:hypothetical protein